MQRIENANGTEYLREVTLNHMWRGRIESQIYFTLAKIELRTTQIDILETRLFPVLEVQKTRGLLSKMHCFSAYSIIIPFGRIEQCDS
jgi:hypothetical protein